jgi:hypothetical protein
LLKPCAPQKKKTLTRALLQASGVQLQEVLLQQSRAAGEDQELLRQEIGVQHQRKLLLQLLLVHGANQLIVYSCKQQLIKAGVCPLRQQLHGERLGMLLLLLLPQQRLQKQQ